MKKLLTILVLFLLSFSQEKQYNVKLSESQIQMMYQTLEVSKSAIQTSTISMTDGIKAIKNIDSVETILREAYIASNDTTKTAK